MKHDNDMTAKRTIRTVLYSAVLPLTLAALSACTENDAAGGTTDADALALRTITVSISDGSAATRTADGPASHAAGSATRAVGSDDSHAPTGSATYGSFATDEKIYCFMPEGRSRLSAVYTVSGDAARVSDGGEPLMASQHATLDVFAYAPCEKGGVSVNEHTASFTVQQDQTSQLALLQSDLLYAAGTVAPKADHITNTAGTDTKLTFSHQLSKLVLQPYYTNGAATVTGARIVSGYRTTELTINVGLMQTPAATDKHSDPITTGSPLTVYSNATGFAAPTSAAAATSAQALVCIVPPQTFAAGESLIQLDVEGIGTITYAIGSTAQTLTAGNAYLVPLPISATTVGTVSITDFTPVAWSYGDDAATHEYTTPRSHQYTVTAADGTPVTFDMVYVEGGTYNSRPLTDFYLGKSEVTQQLWDAVNATAAPSTLTVPVTSQTKTAMQRWIDKLNTMTEGQRPAGYEFSLPTINQFRYAFHGGRYSGGYTYAGSNDLDEVAWHAGNHNNVSYTGDANYKQPVMQKLPNELGLYDMAGNVGEVVSSRYYVRNANGYIVSMIGGQWELDPDNDSFKANDDWRINTNGNHTAYGFRLCLSHNPGKQPIGIVFSTDPSAYDIEQGYTHGYVMALKDCATGGAWGAATPASNTQMTDELFGFTTTRSAKEENDLKCDVNGLKHCRTALAKTGANTLNAMQTAAQYWPANAPTAHPVSSSEWYLPSIGQIYQWLESFSKSYANYYTYFPVETDGTSWTFGTNQAFYLKETGSASPYTTVGDVVLKAVDSYVRTQLTTTYQSLYTTLFDSSVTTGKLWWSSTELSATVAWYLQYHGSGHGDGKYRVHIWGSQAKTVTTDASSGTSIFTRTYIRPVLAF